MRGAKVVIFFSFSLAILGTFVKALSGHNPRKWKSVNNALLGLRVDVEITRVFSEITEFFEIGMSLIIRSIKQREFTK